MHYSLFMNSEFRHVISKNFVNSNFFIFYFYCFRFSVFSKINGIQTDPVSTSQSYPPLATSHYNDQRPTSISHHNPTHFLFFLSLSLSPLYLSFSTQRCWPPATTTIRDPRWSATTILPIFYSSSLCLSLLYVSHTQLSTAGHHIHPPTRWSETPILQNQKQSPDPCIAHKSHI